MNSDRYTTEALDMTNDLTDLERLVLLYPDGYTRDNGNHSEWCWYALSKNLRLSFILSHPELPWVYECIYANKDITTEMILNGLTDKGIVINGWNMPTKTIGTARGGTAYGPWNVELQFNPNITVEVLNKFPDFNWNYNYLESDIPWEYMKEQLLKGKRGWHPKQALKNAENNPGMFEDVLKYYKYFYDSETARQMCCSPFYSPYTPWECLMNIPEVELHDGSTVKPNFCWWSVCQNNVNLDWEWILGHCQTVEDARFNFYHLSLNPTFKVEYAERYPKPSICKIDDNNPFLQGSPGNWDMEVITANANVLWEYILKNPNGISGVGEWNRKSVSSNPNVPWEVVYKDLQKPEGTREWDWDLYRLSFNKGLMK